MSLLWVSITAILAAMPATSAESDPRCSPWAGRLESAEGTVLWSHSAQNSWREASRNQLFCYGDTLKVFDGRAALRLTNDTLVRLNTDSTIKLIPPQQSFWLELIEGAALFLSRTPQAFTVKTPYLNAAIDGTEFLVSSDTSETRVAVFEGQVSARNERGAVALEAGQQTYSRGVAAPLKISGASLQQNVSWALHYPPVIVDARMPKPIHTAIVQGKFAEALALIMAIDPSARAIELTALGASLALEQGNAGLASDLLDHSLQRDPTHIESLAIRSLITLVQGNAIAAQQQVEALTRIAKDNVTLLIVLSYTRQSQTQLKGALAAAEQALALAPENDLVLARTAELMLILGHHRQAKNIIARAFEQKTQSSKIHTLTGFIELNHYATDEALHHFSKAIDLNSADSLAFLGKGLAHIQNDNLERGRENIEMAVLLDPTSSLLRSYLGKSYHQEQRHQLANSQYQLAKNFDPQDPTPWFYQAHLKQTQNQLPEAVRLIERAISKNDNRAVYRSRLMLDSDTAARSADQSLIYRHLGFDALAADIAANAVAKAPADYAGHRALASALANNPRKQEAKSSEALQATILQPIGAKPLRPSFAENSLKLFPAAGPNRLGVNEYSALFVERGWQGYASALAGTDNIKALEWQAHGVADKTAITLGQYHFSSDDQFATGATRYQVSEVLGQFQPIDQIQLQAELSQRKDTDEGQRSEESQRTQIDSDFNTKSFRVHVTPSPTHTLLLDLTSREIDDTTHSTDTFPDGTVVLFNRINAVERRKSELAYLLTRNSQWAKLGAFTYKHDTIITDESIFKPDFIGLGTISTVHSSKDYSKYYAEAYQAFAENRLSVTLGWARLAGVNDPIHKKSLASAALKWQITERLTIQSAYWEKIAPPELPTLESTAISLFQRSDDHLDRAYSESTAINIHYAVADLHTAVELRSANITAPVPIFPANIISIEAFDEYNIEAHLTWNPWNKMAIALAFSQDFGRHRRNEDDNFLDLGIIKLRTTKTPLTLNYFPNQSWNFRTALTYVSQVAEKGQQQSQGNHFTNLDFTSTWHSRKFPLSVSLSLLNILDKDTQYAAGGISTYGYLSEMGFREFAPGFSAAARMTFRL